jgi:hypothetical protein
MLIQRADAVVIHIDTSSLAALTKERKFVFVST